MKYKGNTYSFVTIDVNHVFKAKKKNHESYFKNINFSNLYLYHLSSLQMLLQINQKPKRHQWRCVKRNNQVHKHSYLNNCYKFNDFFITGKEIFYVFKSMKIVDSKDDSSHSVKHRTKTRPCYVKRESSRTLPARIKDQGSIPGKLSYDYVSIVLFILWVWRYTE